MNLDLFFAGKHGEQTRLAKAIGCPSQLMWQWQARRRPVPIDRCPAIEMATDGGVTCEDLRPDGAWRRVPDADWPWHPNGRPLIDVTRGTAAAAQEVRDAT